MLREQFKFTQEPQTSGTTHEKWSAIRNGVMRKVTVDCHGGEVRAMDVKSIIGQIGCSSKEFWRAVQRC